MADIKPKISLGLPVYNESEFLDETILSLEKQTYENIEIIAIDNGSDDDSYEKLEKYSQGDKRIKIFKNDENIGLSNNFNLIFKKSTGKYFVWIGAHDRYNRNFVEELLKTITSSKNISLVFSNVSNIDKNSQTINHKKNTGFQLLNNNSLLRLLKLPWMIRGSGDIVMGMFDSEILKKTTLFSDSVLWADVFLIYQISKLGKIIRVDEVLRDRRYFRDEEEHFETWESKYKKLTSRFRSPREIGNRKPGLSLYFPVLFMCWNIFYELGIKKFYNPINIIVSIYLITIFLLKRRAALWIDIKTYFSKS
jgi:glycosyltransferase involved in cell wall biosynthesis